MFCYSYVGGLKCFVIHKLAAATFNNLYLQHAFIQTRETWQVNFLVAIFSDFFSFC